jgi:predicted CoA-binding protein
MTDDSELPACEIPIFRPTTKEISEILSNARTIAIVGLSPKENRDSNSVAKYLVKVGYEVIPVNPVHDEIIGLRSYPSISEIPGQVDIVDIFRRLDAVPGIVDEAIRINAKVVWMQENIVHNESARTAESAGLKVVMNKCIMKEHRKWKEERA